MHIKVLENIKVTKLDFFLITIFILYTARASTITDNDFILVYINIFLLILFYSKGFKIDLFIYLMFLIWSLINFFSYIVNEGTDFTLFTLLGSYIRMLMPYLIIKIIGPKFFDKLLIYAYYLALIILPIYVFDFFYHDFFSNLAPYFNFMTQEEQKTLGGWYIFFYMHSAWAFVGGLPWLYRNCGFMWEGGAYSLILIFLLTYYLSKNNFKFDKVVLVFGISVITTFSTSGYLALLILWIGSLYLKGKKNVAILGLMMTLFIIISYYVIQLEFVGNKIELYYYTMFQHYTHRLTGIERVNRFGVLYYYTLQALSWPFGNGVLDSKYLIEKYGVIYEGPNTFAYILYQWGFIGVIIFIWYIKEFYKLFNNEKMLSIIMTVSLSIVLFSNPEPPIKPLIYGIVYYYFLYHKKIIKKPFYKTLSNLSINY